MMKRMLLPVIVLLALAGFVTGALAQITNSAHDLSSNSTYTFKTTGAKSTNQDQTCVFCHTPHTSTSVALLWNRTNPSASSFSMYQPLSGNTGTLGAASLRCLSCHDGVTAFNSLVKGSANNAVTMDTTQVPTGLDLRNEHPVGFNVPFGSSGWQASIGSYAKSYSGNVECASCHDPHNTTGVTKFLRVANTTSRICTSCHSK